MYNKVILIGRLTSTPELHKTNNDKSVARATIAVNRRYKDQNGEREADFVNMVLWGRLAESLASYATKGSLISVDGELRTRRFEKNSQMNYVTEVLVAPNVPCVKIMQAKIWRIWFWKRKNYHFKH